MRKLCFLMLLAISGNCLQVADSVSNNKDTELLVFQIKEGRDPTSVLQAGATGNPVFVPVLKEKLNSHVRPHYLFRREAQMALAKLGQVDQMKAIYCETATGDNLQVSDALSKQLPYVGGWFAIRIFQDVLGGSLATNPKLAKLPADSPIGPIPDYAVLGLQELFPNASVHDQGYPDVHAWQEYLSAHAGELKDLQPKAEFSAQDCDATLKGTK